MNRSSIKRVLKRIIDFRVGSNVMVNVTALPKNKLLANRCAIVTGGTSGIGYSIAYAFLNAGAAVIITGRFKEKTEAIADRLKLNTGNYNVFGFDLDNTNIKSFESKFSEMLMTVQSHGFSAIDILVNNAGVNCKGMPNAIESEYDLVLDTNLKGTFFLSQLFGRYMIANNIHGNILNIASASSLRPADSAYTVSKWGLRGLTLGLAKALGKDGITVNGIAPGPTATPMMLKNGETNMSLDRILLGRYILPEEISNMAVILVSDMGRSIMGDIVYMTGGAGILTYDDVKYSF